MYKDSSWKTYHQRFVWFEWCQTLQTLRLQVWLLSWHQTSLLQLWYHRPGDLYDSLHSPQISAPGENSQTPISTLEKEQIPTNTLDKDQIFIKTTFTGYLSYNKNHQHFPRKTFLTSRLLFSYSFMAVIHWWRVLMLCVCPPFSIVSVPLGGWNFTVVPFCCCWAVAPNDDPPPKSPPPPVDVDVPPGII